MLWSIRLPVFVEYFWEEISGKNTYPPDLFLKMGQKNVDQDMFVNEMMREGMKTLCIHSVSILQFRSQRAVELCCDITGN